MLYVCQSGWVRSRVVAWIHPILTPALVGAESRPRNIESIISETCANSSSDDAERTNTPFTSYVSKRATSLLNQRPAVCMSIQSENPQPGPTSALRFVVGRRLKIHPKLDPISHRIFNRFVLTFATGYRSASGPPIHPTCPRQCSYKKKHKLIHFPPNSHCMG